MTQLRSWLPDAVGGVCWVSVDNPGQSPRIPVFCGTTALPEAFETCGQKQYDPDCLLWRFRRANKLATVAWQDTKKVLTDEVVRLESETIDALPGKKATAEDLTAFSRDVFEKASDAWKALEEMFWLRFGMGF